MCFGNSETGKTTTQTNSSKTMAPWLEQIAQENMRFAQNVQNTPTTPYDYARVAPNTPLQRQAADWASSMLGSYNNNPDIAAARGMFTTAGNAGPQSVNAPQIGQQQGVSPTSVLTNIQDYMSPYTQGALDPTLREIRRGGAIARHGAGGIDSLATSAGAFGDARHGIELAENTRNTEQRAADATAQAYDRAFTQGAGLSQYDKTNTLNADTFNATQNLQRLFQNAGLNMQGQMANAGYAEQALARMLGSGNALNSMGSNTIAQGMGLTQLLAGLGGQQQGVNQATLDAAYQEFLRRQNDPFLRSQVGNAALGSSVPAASYTATGTSTESKSAPNNSGWGMLGSLAGTVLGSAAGPIGSALGGSIGGMLGGGGGVVAGNSGGHVPFY